MKKWLLSLLSIAAFGACASVSAQGQAAAGESKNAMCIGCHGIVDYKTAFPEVYRVPKIAGQNPKYIENALKAYASGDRKHPSMRGISMSLSDQDIADLAAFYELQGKSIKITSGDASAKPSAAAQKVLTVGNCASCHGADFNTPIDPSYPKLGGQHKDYLYVAMRSYLVEGKPYWGRKHAIMSAQMKLVEKELGAKEFDRGIKDLAQHMSKLPAQIHTVPERRFR